MKSREDWLCEQLDRDDLPQQLKEKYNAELDRFAEAYNTRELKRKQTQESERARIKAIKAKILENDEDFIAHFGEEEFGEDYELVEEGTEFVIYSKVARDDQEHRRTHGSLEEAKNDLRYLYYNRLYDRYVRGGELDVLGELVS